MHFQPDVFIGQLVGFAVIVWVVVKYVVPPVKSLMTKQQDQVRRQIADSEQASVALAGAEQAYTTAVAKAHEEGAQIRAEAKEDSTKILAALREQAVIEAARVKQHGEEQALLHRQQLTRELKGTLGKTVLSGATTIVQERLAGDAARSASIDSFIDELESLAASSGGAVS